jgi:hypothetical protein
LPRKGSRVLQQPPASGRGATSRHPPRRAGTDVRHGEPPAAGLRPTLLRRPSPTKPNSVGRRAEHRSRMQARGSPTVGLRIGSD